MIDTKDQEAIKNAILDIVGKKGEIDTEELAKELKVDRQVIVGACKSLEIKEIISLEQKEIKEEELVLTEPVTMEIKSSDLNEGFFSSKKEDKDDFSF